MLTKEKMENMWLFSESFLKRTFAILGHYIVAMAIIYGIGVITLLE